MSDDDHIKPFDVPLENWKAAQPHGSPVIDFGGVRIAHGLRRFNHRDCGHKRLVYSPQERRIWCEECERTIEAYDAFLTVVKYFQDMERAVLHRLNEAETALKATLVRRVSKAIDRAWGRKMGVCCPHCRAVILPEDGLGNSSASAEIERARRKKLGVSSP